MRSFPIETYLITWSFITWANLKCRAWRHSSPLKPNKPNIPWQKLGTLTYYRKSNQPNKIVVLPLRIGHPPRKTGSSSNFQPSFSRVKLAIKLKGPTNSGPLNPIMYRWSYNLRYANLEGHLLYRLHNSIYNDPGSGAHLVFGRCFHGIPLIKPGFFGAQVEKNTKVHAVLRLEPLVQWSYKVRVKPPVSHDGWVGVFFFAGFKKPCCCFWGWNSMVLRWRENLMSIGAHLVVAVVVLIWCWFSDLQPPQIRYLIWRNTLQGKS